MEQKEITVKELSIMTDIHEKTIYKYLLGDRMPQNKHFQKLVADGLGESADEIFFELNKIKSDRKSEYLERNKGYDDQRYIDRKCINIKNFFEQNDSQAQEQLRA